MAATQNFGNMTDLEKVERHRASFNENIAKMQEAVSKNSKFLTRADHDRKVARLLALNNVEEKATLSDMNLTRSSFEHRVKWELGAEVGETWNQPEADSR